MRPTMVAILLLISMLAGCTIREESFAPTGDEPSSTGLSVTPTPMPSIPEDSSSCPGGFARGSDAQTYRDGTQDLFCD